MSAAFGLGEHCWQKYVKNLTKIGPFQYEADVDRFHVIGAGFDWKFKDGEPFGHLPFESALAIASFHLERGDRPLPQSIKSNFPRRVTSTHWLFTDALQVVYEGFMFDWVIQSTKEVPNDQHQSSLTFTLLQWACVLKEMEYATCIYSRTNR